MRVSSLPNDYEWSDKLFCELLIPHFSVGLSNFFLLVCIHILVIGPLSVIQNMWQKSSSVLSFHFPLCVCQWCLTLCDPWTALARLLCPWDFAGSSTAVGCHFLLLRLEPSFLHLLHWQADSLPLHHLGSPFTFLMVSFNKQKLLNLM